MNIGERIKILRASKDITQEEFGERIGLNQKQISKFESNRAIPTTETIIKICEEFKISADWLLFGDKQNEDIANRPEIEFFLKRPAAQIQLLTMLSNVSEKEQIEILGAVRMYKLLIDSAKEINNP